MESQVNKEDDMSFAKVPIYKGSDYAYFLSNIP